MLKREVKFTCLVFFLILMSSFIISANNIQITLTPLNYENKVEVEINNSKYAIGFIDVDNGGDAWFTVNGGRTHIMSSSDGPLRVNDEFFISVVNTQKEYLEGQVVDIYIVLNLSSNYTIILIDDCQDECESGTRMCYDAEQYQLCGNFDEDECSEWGNPVECGSDTPVGPLCKEEDGTCLIGGFGESKECLHEGETVCLDEESYGTCVFLMH